MKIQLNTPKRKWYTLPFRFCLLILLIFHNSSNAQTYVSNPISGTISSGSYYHNHSISIVPNTTISPGTGQTVDIYITDPDCVPLATQLSQDRNYISTLTPREPFTDATTLSSKNTCEVMQTVQYIDGLGRPIQTVQVKGSSGLNDVIMPMAYDDYGREPAKFLPYTTSTGNPGSFRTSAVTDQAAFYASPPSGVSTITSPYAKTAFEYSPLNRPIEQGAPGDAWQLTGTTGLSVTPGHTFKTVYALNDQSTFSSTYSTGTPNHGGRMAALYTATINTDGTRTLSRASSNTATYGSGELSVTISKDENWQSGDGCLGTTEEYKDKEGHVILKRTYNLKNGVVEMLSTYYVYDALNLLAFVLPPGADPDAATAISSTTLNNFGYQYQYDERSRMIKKKLPGKDWEYMVYNSLDQVVATQDGNQRNKANQDWTYTKYDAFGRVVMTGIYNYGATAGQDYYSNVLSTVNGLTDLWETATGTNTNNGYTNQSFPISDTGQTLSVNYYSNYSFAGTNPHTYGSGSNATGLLTGSQVNVLGTSVMLWTVAYYDDKGRNIKTFKEHYLGGTYSSNNYDEVTNTYGFTNELLTSKREHHTNAAGGAIALTVNNTYDYDHMGRKVNSWEQINNGTNVLLNQSDYNEIGQLKAKHLHSINSGTNFLQTLDYRYNPRGWLTSINNADLSNDGGVTNSDSNDQFGIEFKYDGTTTTDKQYNGNISTMKWKAATVSSFTPTQLGYDFRYDKLNRLNEAVSSTTGTKDGNYSEFVSYDLMGNIKTLGRYATIASAKTHVDSLIYTYTGNQHTRIDDNTSQAAGLNDLSQAADEYTYDYNGNNNKDLNRNITSISYNQLNLPATVTFGNGNTSAYTYSADGNKLKKVFTSGSNITTTEYIDGIEYDQGTLAFIQTEDGRVRNSSGYKYKYEYDLKDQLGNNRVTVIPDPTDATEQTPKAIQVNSYYAFGLDMPNQNNTVGTKNEYLYNGKELQEELGQYDYGARFYDPAIGRWTTSDPLAEKSRRWSPYNYVENNPVRLIDPDGMENEDPQKKVNTTVTSTEDKSGKLHVTQTTTTTTVVKTETGSITTKTTTTATDIISNSETEATVRGDVTTQTNVITVDGNKTTTTLGDQSTVSRSDSKADLSALNGVVKSLESFRNDYHLQFNEYVAAKGSNILKWSLGGAAAPFGAWASLSKYAPTLARVLGFTGTPTSVGPGLGKYLIDPFTAAKSGTKMILVTSNGVVVSDIRPQKYK